jgi:Family of unknown function (DUF6088)
LKKSIELQIVSRIYGNGRGWAFSPKDFAQLGTRVSIDVALNRLHSKDIIRRVMRGVYDYPKFSELLEQALSPDLDQVANSLARKFGWKIEITGASALNLLGLSTQVPGRIVYASNGPNKAYKIGKQTLEFRSHALKETKFKYRESFIIVQAIKSLGNEQMSQDAVCKIANWIPLHMCDKILKDTATTSDWVYTYEKNNENVCGI